MTEEVRVRVGVPEDMDGLMRLSDEVARENGISQPDFNRVAAEMWASLHREHGIVGVIGEPGAPLEAFVLLRIGQTWYSEGNIIEERTVFVSKKYRSAKGGRARKLCEFSKKVSQELEMPLLIGVLSHQQTEAKMRLYRRLFGEPSGAFWLWGAETGEWSNRPAAE
jgi:hypothetical protein